MQSVVGYTVTALPIKNLVAQARSGKELSYLVGMFQRLDLFLAYNPQAMLICPTIELAKKVFLMVSKSL